MVLPPPKSDGSDLLASPNALNSSKSRIKREPEPGVPYLPPALLTALLA